MNQILALRKLGFSVTVAGADAIDVEYPGLGPLPEAALPLFEKIKKNKEEALLFLHAERELECRGIFRTALVEVESGWLHGLLEHVQRKHPDLWTRILMIEDRLEEGWRAAKEGTVTMDDFRQVVGTWKDLHLQAVHEHRARSCKDCPDEEAAACRTIWRDRDRRMLNKQEKEKRS